uniref:Uncharacterized protein n=1 Tax=Tetranychus urticae TaxID=32264 RepID=T1KGU0_TETUR
MINLQSFQSSTKLFLHLLIITTISLIAIAMANPSSQFFLNGRYGRRSLPPDSSESQFSDKDNLEAFKLKDDPNPICFYKGLIGLFKCIAERNNPK